MKRLSLAVLIVGAIWLFLFQQLTYAATASFAFDGNNVKATINKINNKQQSTTFTGNNGTNEAVYTYTWPSGAKTGIWGLEQFGYSINDPWSSDDVGIRKVEGDEFSTWLTSAAGPSGKPYTWGDFQDCSYRIIYYASKSVPDDKRIGFVLSYDAKNYNACRELAEHLFGTTPGKSTNDLRFISAIGGTKPPLVDTAPPKYMQDFLARTNGQPAQNQINPEATIAAANGSDTEKLACAASMKGGVGTVLKWFACPIVDGMVSLAAFTDNLINELLTINTSTIFGYSSAAKSYHDIWANFRNLAAGLIVIAALVMVVSQVAGLEIMSAYTVRKILPRLLFAVVFIASSWAVLGLLISLSNDLGTGIRSLFYGPFIANGANSLSFGTALLLQFFGFTGLAAGAAYGVIAFGWMGLFLFAITAVLGALVAFAVIVFRELLVTVLVVMAPLAIAASILPNTQKFWTMWKSALMSVLIVFPIISAMIAGGHVLAFVAAQDQSNLGRQVVGFIAYFTPYFLLPMAFKMAGGLIGTVTGMVNDRSKGVFDRLRNARGNLAKNNMENFKYGQRFKSNTGLGGALNRAGGTYGAFTTSKDKAGFLSLGQAGRDSRAQARMIHGDMAAARYGDTVQAKMMKENDDVNRALTYSSASEATRRMGVDWGMSREKVQAAVAGAKAAGGFGRAQQVNALRTLADTGTGYDNLEQLHKSVYRVHGKDKTGATSTLGYINYVAGKNRIDLKAGMGKQLAMYDATVAHNSSDAINSQIEAVAANAETRYSALDKKDENYSKNVKEIDEDIKKQIAAIDNSDTGFASAIQEGYISAVKGNDIVSLLRSKPAAIKNTAPALKRALNLALKKSEEDGNAAEAARLTGIINQVEQTAAVYASPEIADISAQQLIVPTINAREQVLDKLVADTPLPSSYNVSTIREAEKKQHEAAVALSALTPNYQSGAPISTPGDIAANAKLREQQMQQRVNGLGVSYNPANPNDLNNPANPNSPLYKK